MTTLTFAQQAERTAHALLVVARTNTMDPTAKDRLDRALAILEEDPSLAKARAS